MKTLKDLLVLWNRKLALTPEQAELLATIKRPCC